MHLGTLKSPSKAPLRGIQLPKRQSQSIRDWPRVCIVTPSLPVKKASLIEERCLVFDKYSTEPDSPSLFLTKSTPATERDSH